MRTEIQDLRRIRFPKEVLPLALAANPATLGLRVAPAEIEDIAVETRVPPALKVTFRPIQSSPCEQRTVGAPALAAALIAYCRHIRMPVSRTARKSIALDGSAVVLMTEYRKTLEDGAVTPPRAES